MDTLELLLKHYNFRPFISLEEAGSFWGHTAKTMKEKIDAGEIRLPYFTPDGKQKSREARSRRDGSGYLG
jgi:hypothetical protein